MTFEQALLRIGFIYAAEVAEHGGRSLARIAVLVVNRGSFFTGMQEGRTCSLRNFEKFVEWFQVADHWPQAKIPVEAAEALASMGRPLRAAA